MIGCRTRRLPLFVLFMLLTALLAGCQRSVEHVVPIAATPAVVECASRVAAQRGYQPSQNPAKDGQTRLVRNLFGQNGDPPQEGNAVDSSIQDYLTIRADGDRLRMEVVGATIEGKERAPSPRTLAHLEEIAALIVTQCSTSN